MRRRRAVALAGCSALLLLALLLGVSVGAAPLSPVGVTATLLRELGLPLRGGLPQVQSTVLLELRLPRVLVAALVGGVLAMAGAAYQGVFRNPLADPYLLGAAAGAGLGATMVIVYLPHSADTVPVAAFAGALAGVGLAYALGPPRARRVVRSATLLLAGVAVASFLTAIQTLVQQSHANDLRQVYSWILGQLGRPAGRSCGWCCPTRRCRRPCCWARAGRSMCWRSVTTRPPRSGCARGGCVSWCCSRPLSARPRRWR